MATIREVVDKAVELKAEQEKLEALVLDRQRAQTRLAETNAAIAAQQPVVQALADQLRALINA